ncbi:MAG TPA: hypothetical protein VKF41_11370 [Bryobacteraceae bacterium]|nr:hypothetical protein [Bryobacteraceae bacterium]
MSQLMNATHKIAWTEFTTHKSDPMPAAGTVAPAAYTLPVISTQGFGLEGIPGSKPPKAKLKDTIVVSVSLGAASWVEDWVFNLPQAKQDELLNHEQGHFTVGGLLARDFYYDLLKLRQKEYSSPAESTADFNGLKNSRDAAFKAIVDKYDADTKHGTVAAQQARWDGFLSSAANQPRNPPETAQDGTALKIRLVDLLKTFGITI